MSKEKILLNDPTDYNISKKLSICTRSNNIFKTFN